MLKFFKGVIGSSGGIKDLPCNIGDPYPCAWGYWNHYRRISKLSKALGSVQASCYTLHPQARLKLDKVLSDQCNQPLSSQEEESSLVDKLKDLKIFSAAYKKGSTLRGFCPKCGGGTDEEKSLSCTISSDGFCAKWICFRATCGWRGYIEASGFTHSNHDVRVPMQKLTEESLGLQELSDTHIRYFQSRGISLDTLSRNHVKQLSKGDKSFIAFPYWKDGKILTCMYHTCNHECWQEQHTPLILYGLDDIQGVKDSGEIIIVLGEMNKLAMEEAGKRTCVSAPRILPSKRTEMATRSRKVKEELAKNIRELPDIEDNVSDCLKNCEEYFNKSRRIVLAMSSDELGEAFAKELARRLGRERCWCVKWPTKADGSVCKDALEVLQLLGKQALRRMVDASKLLPIQGLFRFSEFNKEIDDYFNVRFGNEIGISTGWSNLDPFYRVVPGELTIVTGVPSSGKSEWIDAVICNLNRSNGWKFALCSMENQAKEHGRKLLEKYIKKPFFPYSYTGIKRMTKEEYEKGKQWLTQNFYLIRCNNDGLPSVQWVLNVAKSAILRYGIRGLVIDPYNELDHQRPPNMTETEYVSQMLTKIKRFAQHHDCHVWFVAHPRQLLGWNGEAPSLYDISGSAHFINKCDAGVVVHRNRDPGMGPMDGVQILVRKMRNKAAGTIGDASLMYDRVTGTYNACVDHELMQAIH